MHELSLSEIKESQLETLDTIHEFCKANSLTYFLAGGTLIGAIRHNGYIPWDDDIDLYMPRKDYLELIKGFNSFDSRFRVYSTENCKEYRLPFAKVCDERTLLEEDAYRIMPNEGVYVDIFPLDSSPVDIVKKQRLIKKEHRLNMISSLFLIPDADRGFIKNAILFLIRRIDKILGYDYFGKRRNRLAEKYGNPASEELCMVMGIAPELEFYEKSLFSSSILVTFEAKKRNIPIGYDIVLKQRYGNYMELPPEEERVTHHRYTAYKKE